LCVAVILIKKYNLDTSFGISWHPGCDAPFIFLIFIQQYCYSLPCISQKNYVLIYVPMFLSTPLAGQVVFQNKKSLLSLEQNIGIE
jgi:hypothetical protein